MDRPNRTLKVKRKNPSDILQKKSYQREIKKSGVSSVMD